MGLPDSSHLVQCFLSDSPHSDNSNTLHVKSEWKNGRYTIHPTLQVLISGYHHWYPGTCTNPLPVFVLLYKALKSKYAGAADNVIQSVHFYIYQSQSGTVSNTPIKPTSSIYSNNCSFIKPRLYDGGTRRGSHYKIFLATHSIPVNFQYQRGISQSSRQAGAGLRVDCWCWEIFHNLRLNHLDCSKKLGTSPTSLFETTRNFSNIRYCLGKWPERKSFW